LTIYIIGEPKAKLKWILFIPGASTLFPLKLKPAVQGSVL